MANVSLLSMPEPYEIDSPPDTIADQNDLQAWRDLFKARKEWTFKLVDDCAHMSEEAQARYGEVAVIARSLHIAVVNLAGHIAGLEQKFGEAQTWAQDIITDYEARIDQLDQSLSLLRLLPSTSNILHFIDGQDSNYGNNQANLVDLLNLKEVQQAKTVSRDAIGEFKANLENLRRDFKKLGSGMDRVAKREEDSVGSTASARSEESITLMEDIKAISTKVENDHETLLGYPNTQKSISQASKTALLHTRSFLPSLSNRCVEMNDLLIAATKMRNKATVEAVEIMQGIATLNTMCTDVNQRTAALEILEDDQKALELLLLVERLPIVYASFVAEAIRRREWTEKMKSDSSTLANEMATFQDEEGRRRKKWQKNTGCYFWQDKPDRKVIGLEVNLLGEEDQWPLTSRQDLEELIDRLHSANANPDIISEVSKVLSDLNSPTKQQTRRAKAFKNGSFHETALGRSTLLVRGDDDLIRSIQDEKSKVETKLKGAESRVRKLESLLHQQSQTSRTSAGNVFQLPSSISPDEQDGSNVVGSPHFKDEISRPSSVASRRYSANKTLDEKAVTQRLISLESELIAERERASGLEKEAAAKTAAVKDLKSQVEEAISTKQDLMRNLEAQQREFGSERKSLEDDNRRLKGQLEDYEDSIDRVIGSRENERLTLDDQLHALRSELNKTKADAEAESQKAQGQVDFLRNDAQLQRETNENLEKQLARLREENRELRTRVDSTVDAQKEVTKSLHGLHSLLFPSADIPPQVSDLAEALSSRTMDIVAQLDVHQRDLAVMQSDRDATQHQLSEVRKELAVLKEKLASEEAESFRLRETVGEEQARFAALESDMAEHHEQLTGLRTKFAEGRTGSEALRSRVEEEERKVTSLTEQLASSRSQVGSIQEELRSVEDRLQASQGKLESVNSRLDGRTMRAKDLTQRLYAQNDRMLRLLDRLCYSVSREGDSMIITRIPRTERVNANDSSDPGLAMRRSISGQTRKPMIDSGELELLYWMQNEDAEVEGEKYEAYLSAMGNFDIEAFCETIVKRIKDTEHQARKATRDARMYRDKSHAAQKEAHEKIAYKHFKDGDLALFLPTRNQTNGAWAAFNVGAPHYFLREQESHKLRTRDWLLARIQKIEDRVVDLSKSMTAQHSNAGDRGSISEASNGGDSFEDDNPFDLSDGLRWYLIDAAEEKPGAPPLTPSLGKSTVAEQNVDATGSIRHSKNKSGSAVDNISKTLSRSLDSRRSSNNSRRAAPFASTSVKRPDSVIEDSEQAAKTGAKTDIGEDVRSEAAAAAAAMAADMTPTPSQQQHPPQLLSASSSGLEVRDSHSVAIDSLLGP
jgi:autophagy-related protein 11